MRSHIQIMEKNGIIELTIHKEIRENIWEKVIRTSSPRIIKDVMREIKYEIASSNLNKEDLNILLKDQSTVSIKNYTKLKNNAILRPITSKIDSHIKQTRFKMARAAIIGLGAFMGISSFGRKTSYAKENEAGIESEEEMLENIDEITVKEGNDLSSAIMDDTATFTSVTDEAIPEVIDISAFLIEEAELETETDELDELDAIMENKNIEEQKESNEENIQAIKEAIPMFGEVGMDEKRSFVHENYGDIVQKYANISGIDASVIECILAQERGEHSREIEHHGAIGVAQIQYNMHINQTRSLYNVQTGETENFVVTDELIRDLEGNIKTGVSILQTYLNRYDGNIFLAVQAYNYGHGGVNDCLASAEKRTGISVEEMIHNPECLVWVEDVQNYKDGNWGDPNYLNNVFKRYVENELTTSYQENSEVVQLNANGKSR